MNDNPSRPESVYAALERLPSSVVGEVIGGELYVSPEPRIVQNQASNRLLNTLELFDEEAGEAGPGGWLILSEPRLHLHGDVLEPDFAGWQCQRLPKASATVGWKVTPDWLCEVLSAPTEALDRSQKMAVYAREGVKHLWLVDPRSHSLEVYRLEEDGRWLLLSTHTGDIIVHAEPFDALPLKLGSLWRR